MPINNLLEVSFDVLRGAADSFDPNSRPLNGCLDHTPVFSNGRAYTSVSSSIAQVMDHATYAERELASRNPFTQLYN